VLKVAQNLSLKDNTEIYSLVENCCFMSNLRHPRFLVGIFTILLGMIAIGFRANRDSQTGGIVAIIAAALFIICWIWGIIEVATTNSLEGSQKKFWLIAVIAVPFVGGMLYSWLHSRRNTIVD
jgi:hypothetical protein